MINENLESQIDDAIRYFLIDGSEEDIDRYFDELTILLPFEKEKSLMIWFLDLIKDQDSKAEIVIYRRLNEIQKITGC